MGDRPLLLLWLQNLPWPWPHLGQGRWQELQVPVLPHPQGAHAEKEPQEDHLGRSVPQEAQEGSRGGCDQKRTRRAQKFQRAVVGATLQDIMAKRNQKPEVRK